MANSFGRSSPANTQDRLMMTYDDFHSNIMSSGNTMADNNINFPLFLTLFLSISISNRRYLVHIICASDSFTSASCKEIPISGLETSISLFKPVELLNRKSL